MLEGTSVESKRDRTGKILGHFRWLSRLSYAEGSGAEWGAGSGYDEAAGGTSGKFAGAVVIAGGDRAQGSARFDEQLAHRVGRAVGGEFCDQSDPGPDDRNRRVEREEFHSDGADREAP